MRHWSSGSRPSVADPRPGHARAARETQEGRAAAGCDAQQRRLSAVDAQTIRLRRLHFHCTFIALAMHLWRLKCITFNNKIIL